MIIAFSKLSDRIELLQGQIWNACVHQQQQQQHALSQPAVGVCSVAGRTHTHTLMQARADTHTHLLAISLNSVWDTHTHIRLCPDMLFLRLSLSLHARTLTQTLSPSLTNTRSYTHTRIISLSFYFWLSWLVFYYFTRMMGQIQCFGVTFVSSQVRWPAPDKKSFQVCPQSAMIAWNVFNIPANHRLKFFRSGGRRKKLLGREFLSDQNENSSSFFFLLLRLNL